MSAIPYGIVRARRTTGGILLLSSLVSVVAVSLKNADWLTAPPVVHAVSPGVVTSAAATPPGPTPASTPSATATPTTPPTAHDQLAALRAQDAARVEAVPDGYWVPQLASNRPGTYKQGHTWDEAEILQDHLTRRNQYDGALLWSGDFKTFKSSNYWVTVVPSQASSSADAVIAWCDSEQIDRDHCFAKRLSTTSPYTGDNTRNGR